MSGSETAREPLIAKDTTTTRASDSTSSAGSSDVDKQSDPVDKALTATRAHLEIHRHWDEVEDEDGDEADESTLKTPGRFIWALTFAAGVSGLLFGY
ncbi:hypothetical protein LTR60_007367, partial [Cryomyces antarcticus]